MTFRHSAVNYAGGDRYEQTEQDKKGKKRQFEQITGTFSASRSGFGFVNTEKGEIFLPARAVNGAINGDTVTVNVISRDNPLGAEGAVAGILERTEKYLPEWFPIPTR